MCDGVTISAFNNITRSLYCIKSCWTKHQREINYEHLNVKTTCLTYKGYEQQIAGAWEDVG